MMNLTEKKESISTGYIMNVNYRKISFERTRGVRNRICVFSSDDKNEINERIKNKNLNIRKFKKR